MVDRYSCFADLAAKERLGFDYQIRWEDRRSMTAIIAPHGGSIEPGTSEIAEAIAGEYLTFYAFEALKRGPHGAYHITSHLFDEPQALKLVGKSETAIAIHGRRDTKNEAVWLGGRSTELRDAIGAELRQAGFDAEPNRALPGRHPRNICNMTATAMGVQLELSRSLRERLLQDADELRLFCDAIRSAVE